MILMAWKKLTIVFVVKQIGVNIGRHKILYCYELKFPTLVNRGKKL